MTTPQNHSSSTNSSNGSQIVQTPVTNMTTATTQGTNTPPPTNSPTVNIENHAARYWQILQNNAEWIRFSDSKAGIILTTYGVLFTIIYTNAAAVFTAVKDNNAVYVFVILFGIAALFSISTAFWAIRPRLKNSATDSIIYFGHIAKHTSAEAYKTHATPILGDQHLFTDHLTNQIYNLSVIAKNKYFFTSLSIISFVVSLAFLLGTVVIYIYHLLNK